MQKTFVELKYSGKKLGMPPEMILYFDLTLFNDSQEPRWILLPVWITDPLKTSGAGVDGVDVHAFEGKGHVIIGQFQGAGRFHALLVGAKSKVVLRKYPVLVWDEDIKNYNWDVNIVMASKVMVGNEPVQEWFGLNPLCDDQSDVLADHGKILKTRHTPDRSEVPVLIDEVRREIIKVNIAGV
jgi:hypothetical protein